MEHVPNFVDVAKGLNERSTEKIDSEQCQELN